MSYHVSCDPYKMITSDMNFSLFFYESIRRGNFTKYLFLGVWYLFLQNFEKALLENLICSYGISFSWKIVCALTKFWTRSPGNFKLFLYDISSSWKIVCVLAEFWESSPGNFDVIVHLPLLENLYVFLYHIWFS